MHSSEKLFKVIENGKISTDFKFETANVLENGAPEISGHKTDNVLWSGTTCFQIAKTFTTGKSRKWS